VTKWSRAKLRLRSGGVPVATSARPAIQRSRPLDPPGVLEAQVRAGGSSLRDVEPTTSFRSGACHLALPSPAKTGEQAAPNPGLSRSLGEIAETDFQRRKALAYARGRSSPPIRLAAFLVTLSRNNAREGRDPKIIPDTLNCGAVAEMLGLEVSALATALLELANKHLIELVPEASLRISDMQGLERFADGKGFDSPLRSSRINQNRAGPPAKPNVQYAEGPFSAATLWRTLWSEAREVLWLLVIVTGLSIASVSIAALLVAVLTPL
jgi:hypothetical protein